MTIIYAMHVHVFVLFCFMSKGSSVGTAITYIMCGHLIVSFGWESVFYVSGALGLFWCIGWMFFVYDSPAKHPTISMKERIYIETCIGQNIKTRSKPVKIINILNKAYFISSFDENTKLNNIMLSLAVNNIVCN